MKQNLEVSQADVVKGMDAPVTPKPFDITTAPIKKGVDLRDGAEYRKKAAEMEVDDAVEGMPKDAAGKLYRAIEDKHGLRTATMKCAKDGTYTVKRVAQRPEVKRAPRKASSATPAS